MAKTALVCLGCGYRAHQWVGRCPECGAWDSLGRESGSAEPVSSLADIDPARRPRIPSGISEFDRVMGGGVVSGSTILVAGEPGVGKSTLMVQAAAHYEQDGRKVLLVCGEEAVEMVAERARRVGPMQSSKVVAATDVEGLLSMIPAYDVVIIDSIQTVRDSLLEGDPGGVTQVRSAAQRLSFAARSAGTALFLVGHVTKDGSVAGPRVLEHLVDAVLSFEGDRGQPLRLLRATKNRFGATSELGVFEMTENGLECVADASRLSLAGRRGPAEGSSVAIVLEGHRPVAVEIQALVIGSKLPRRVVSGLDSSRCGLIAAVVDARAGIRLRDFDVYASVVGGFRVDDPGADLALASALTTARLGKSLPHDYVFIGELALSGEVRPPRGLDARLREAQRLGFARAVIPQGSAQPNQIEARFVSNIKEVAELIVERRE